MVDSKTTQEVVEIKTKNICCKNSCFAKYLCTYNILKLLEYQMTYLKNLLEMYMIKSNGS